MTFDDWYAWHWSMVRAEPKFRLNGTIPPLRLEWQSLYDGADVVHFHGPDSSRLRKPSAHPVNCESPS